MKQSKLIEFLKHPNLVCEMFGYTDQNSSLEVHFYQGEKSITIIGHCTVSHTIGDSDDGMPEKEVWHEDGPEISFHEILDNDGDPFNFWEYQNWADVIRPLLVGLVLTSKIHDHEPART